jgi:hypothetical protein
MKLAIWVSQKIQGKFTLNPVVSHHFLKIAMVFSCSMSKNSASEGLDFPRLPPET